ncbi:hypothetical protein B0I35DRAFT_97860 [Stachybotrys elegans]|uniref:Zn(2)-C6 fungal-type domain-containing protein n=1 Tax=Stachybotrys elegans TaxID=80388 RepID=A0A8K0SFK9_9HYPO|nr:hypothetical protein B0I35DRAFT_97860 [Stachybotrys elegans]
MAASQVNNSALPQGFTVYQAAPGAQLQFIPAIGTQELDDMIHAYIPGPASIQEKRATVSIEFLKYTQTTGETFNFYPVLTAVESPAMTDSVSSSYASPMTPSWDFSRLSTAPSVASSRASAHSRQSRKPSSSASSRHPGDVSNLPGMKIMTRDGRDITDSASRGSKTKEQRDHAHLMRIIKACDSCRRKKTKCDPSHRRRGVSQTQAPAAAKVAKRTKTAQPQSAPPPPSLAGHDVGFPVLPQSELDWSLFPPMDDFAMPDMSPEAWDELLAQPQFTDPNTDFLLDQFLADGPLDFQSPQIYTPSTSFSCPPLSAATPSSLAASSFASTSASASGATSPDGLQTSPALPYLQRGEGGSTDYTDFNLYSPRSSFSEDDQMVSIEQPYASHKAGVNHAQSESPGSQAVAPSAWTGDTSRDMHGLMQEWSDWSGSSVLSAHPDGDVGYNVAAIHDAADYSAGSHGLYAVSQGFEDGLDQQSVEVWHERSAPDQQPQLQRTLQGVFAASSAGSDAIRRGVANADLIRAYESILRSGVLHEPDSQQSHVVEDTDPQNMKRSPTLASVHDQSQSSSDSQQLELDLVRHRWRGTRDNKHRSRPDMAFPCDGRYFAQPSGFNHLHRSAYRRRTAQLNDTIWTCLGIYGE